MSSSSGQRPTLIVPIGHTHTITSAAFSPDGRLVLTGSQDQSAKIWDEEGRELATFSEERFPVTAAAWSPDGLRILTGSQDKVAKVWDVYSGEVLLRLEGHERSVYAASFSPDGKRIVTASGDGTLKVWDARSGKLKFTLSGPEDAIRAAAWSPDSRWLLSGADDGSLRLWDARRRRERLTIAAHTRKIWSLAFSPDGKRFISGSEDASARVWEAATGKPLFTLPVGKEKAPVRATAWSPDGRLLLTGDNRGVAALWNAQNGKKRRSFKGHTSGLRTVAFSPDGRRLLTGGRDQVVKSWKTSGGEAILSLRGHGRSITDIAFSRDERLLLSGDETGLATIWDVAAGRTAQVLRGHEKTINAVAFSPDDRRLLTASADGTVKCWKTGEPQPFLTLDHDGKSVNAVDYSDDGSRIATGCSDGAARLWDAASGACLATLRGHDKAVYAVALSPDGQWLLSGSSDHTARLWAVTDQRVVHTLTDHTDTVRAVAFSPDGRQLLTGSYDSTACLWDAASGTILHSLTGHAYDIRAVAFSPDGKQALTGAYDETARVWNVATGECRLILEGHQSAPRAVAFSQTGHHILTGSRDNTIKIWNSILGHEIATLIQIGLEDWVTTTPAGLFDASPRAMDLMHYIIPYRDNAGAEWVRVDLDQLKERYFEPGLLSKILGFRAGGIRDVSAFTDVDLFPRVDAAIAADQLRLRLTERNGGVGKVSLFINGKEVVEDGNPQRQTDFAIPLSDFEKYALPDEATPLDLRAYNAAGWLKSRPYRLWFAPRGSSKGLGRSVETRALPRARQHLYAIVVGTSRYGADRIRDLTFPDKDAADIAHALHLAGSRLFDAPPHIHLLTTDIERPEQLAGKANIEAAFRAVAATAEAQDVLVVYFSGHGANHGDGENGQFYYLTRDLASDNLNDPAIRRAGAISSRELTAWINAIAAGKQVLILDTCHAGKVVDNLSGGRAVDESVRIRALDRIKDRTGMFVLAGSAADHLSYETSLFGQGLLTYSLLFGMKGGALREGREIDVSLLFQHARDQVPQLALEIHRQQEPVVVMPRGGASFSLGIADEEVRQKITINASRKPILASSLFLDTDTFYDPLGLAPALDRYFQCLHALGKEAPLVFVHSRELAIAYGVHGLYTRKAGKLHVEGRVFQGVVEKGAFRLTAAHQEGTIIAKEIGEKVLHLLAAAAAEAPAIG